METLSLSLEISGGACCWNGKKGRDEINLVAYLFKLRLGFEIETKDSDAGIGSGNSGSGWEIAVYIVMIIRKDIRWTGKSSEFQQVKICLINSIVYWY